MSGPPARTPHRVTGARIAVMMLNEMRRRNARYRVETMFIGGGQGLTAIFER